ncbi:hypothetical protein SAMN02745751_03025 [Dethiosulfatibacter aminovorans DSM 17477]|uniref:Uncharacterized protein n=1 Tax=Dethiosulfatibacter aminovorans DSM 17477 TaxID=1121476 RepID=A0A1M6KZN2_9FIRM|nr:hypothetical protein [Dethiosulfatibacter aminovorans]SHJ64410.1 hypothetical protein SAMN02745751_03025 [Dethiosulfatibacter aminovorans DSM 17477]
MAKIIVNPGICGLITEIEVEAVDGMNAEFKVESQCGHIRKLADDVPSVNGYEEVFKKYGEGAIAKAAAVHCSHAACPVPTAMLKGVEVACSLALPKEVEIKFE